MRRLVRLRADVVKKRMQKKRLSIRGLARRIDMSHLTIMRALRGYYVLHETAEKIAKVLGVRVEDIVEDALMPNEEALRQFNALLTDLVNWMADRTPEDEEAVRIHSSHIAYRPKRAGKFYHIYHSRDLITAVYHALLEFARKKYREQKRAGRGDKSGKEKGR